MSERYTVLIPDRLRPPPTVEQETFGPAVDIVVPTAESVTAVPDDDWATADAVLAWHDLDFTPAVLNRLDSCEILVRVGVGYDNVDLDAAADAGIPVCNVPDYGTNDVADHAMALLLSLWRGVPHYSGRVKESNDAWQWETDLEMRRLTDAKLAVIGLGRIGSAVARRAQAFGIDVVAYDPYLDDGFEKSLGVEQARDLESAIADADLVSFHAPLTAETRGMADEAFFETLADGAVVVNTSRGEIIDLDALTAAMRDGTVRAAGLDVLETEPPDPNHPLIRAWRDDKPWIRGRLQLTPHAAFYCDEALEEMRRKAARTARDYIEDGVLRNCVNENRLAGGASATGGQP